VAEYEYRAVAIPAGADRAQTKDLLSIHAEYGDWELADHTLWSDGRRRVTVRRRVRPQLPPMPS
jgi:hypothetical protein